MGFSRQSLGGWMIVSLDSSRVKLFRNRRSRGDSDSVRRRERVVTTNGVKRLVSQVAVPESTKAEPLHSQPLTVDAWTALRSFHIPIPTSFSNSSHPAVSALCPTILPQPSPSNIYQTKPHIPLHPHLQPTLKPTIGKPRSPVTISKSQIPQLKSPSPIPRPKPPPHQDQTPERRKDERTRKKEKKKKKKLTLVNRLSPPLANSTK